MNIFRLLQIHLELECVTFDHRGDLIFLPCPEPDVMPRVYLGQHAQGYTTLYHHDLAPQLRKEIYAIPPELAFQEPDRIKQILAQDVPCKDIWHGKSYVFDQPITGEQFPDVTRVDHTSSALFADASRITAQPTFAIVRDGESLSSCESSRENKHAGEAWVRTSAEYRRRGYARQTAFAWAYDLQQKNKIPFYSHETENTASEALAKSLGVTHWITDIAFP